MTERSKPPPKLADVEVRIRRGAGDDFRVEVRLDGEQEWEGGLTSEPIEKGWVPSSSETDDGIRLFEWLFGSQGGESEKEETGAEGKKSRDWSVAKAWSYIKGRQEGREEGRRIRLRIDPEERQLHEVPWEQLREPGAREGTSTVVAAARDTPFSRYLAVPTRAGTPVFERPVKLLLAIANPPDLATYKLQPVVADDEIELLREAGEHPELEITVLEEPCTLSAIRKALEEGFHILHYVGHGAVGKKGAVLYMVDEADEQKTRMVSEVEFAEMIETASSDKLRLVFLSSCQTAIRGTVDAFSGFAPALVMAGVPAVVAMQDLVPVETAHKFSTEFYLRLLEHGLVDLAANQARSALLTAKIEGASIPVVFMRLRGGDLLGYQGTIRVEDDEAFWNALIDKIEDKECLPFLGPRFNNGLLASRDWLVEEFAERCGYPLPERRGSDLMAVTQWAESYDRKGMQKLYFQILKESLGRRLGVPPPDPKDRPAWRKPPWKGDLLALAEALEWSEKVYSVDPNPLPHLLADLELPLYVTTNPDPLMYLALKAREKQSEEIDEVRPPMGPLWDPSGEAHSIDSIWTNDEDDAIDKARRPVVFHLCGHAGDRKQESNLVLSENDHLAYLTRLANEDEQDRILPPDFKTTVFRSSFLFLGYSLDDWEFRLLLHGLVRPALKDPARRLKNIGVQLEPQAQGNTEEAVRYLERYLLDDLKINVYWGNTKQFIIELHERFGGWAPTGDDK